MKNQHIIFVMYEMPQTVFTMQELQLLFPLFSHKELQNKLYYAIQTGKIRNVRRGMYTKNTYHPYELANKLYTPSYISFETILAKEGLIFQHETMIRVASYLSRQLQVDSHILSYRKLPQEVLINTQGIEYREHASIASKERAFLDAVFLYKNYHFDSLRPLDWDRVIKLMHIYPTKAFTKRVKEYYQLFQNEHAR